MVPNAACGKPVVPTAPIPQPSAYKTPFVLSFEPFKAEKKLISEWAEKKQMEHWQNFGCVDETDIWTRGNYPYGYGIDLDTLRFKEVFRSKAEVEWVKTFDRLGLPWESEPLKFDMGPDYVSYTPDFRVTGLSIPGSDRALFIEVKRFPDDVNLTKYVRFTEWYNCDLLVLAHEQGGMPRPKKENYFLVFKCTHCGTYDCFSLNDILLVKRQDPDRPNDNTYDCLPCDGMPPDDYKPPNYEHSHAGSRPSTARRSPLRES